MSSELTLRHSSVFGIDFEVYTINGEEFISMPQFARGIGYESVRPLHKLIGRHASEFVNKTRVVNLDTVQNQRVTVINREGVIRACMLAKAPRAKEFRDVAEHILFKVVTEGYYNSPVLTQILNQLNETVMIQGRMLNNLADRVNSINLIPAPQDNSFWPTPAERARTIVAARRIPRYFNRGGSFDWFASVRHARVRGGLLSQRNRRHLNKMPDYVIQPCPENDQFIRETFESWVAENPYVQGRLDV